MTDSGIRRWYMVEAVLNLGCLAGRLRVGHRAAGDQPHDQLNAFRTGLAHVVDVRLFGEPYRIGDELVHESFVELLIDESGSRALELVAHAARTPHLDVDVLFVGFDRLANRAPKLEAAVARRDGIEHHVDSE